jgi:hypothetical protein
MAVAIQSLTRGSIRRSVGKNLGIVTDGVATSNGLATTLIDTINLVGGDDEFNGREVMIYDATGSIADGSEAVVSDFTGSTNTATVNAAFDGADITTALDKYEMWKTPWRIADINDAINQAINDVTSRALKIKEIHTPFTEASKYLYDVLSGFTHISKVEYVYNKGAYHLLDNCEDAWTGGTGTTITADTAFKKVGNASSKNVVVGVGVTTILCYKAISSTDISDCDKVEFWMYSSIALTAGQLQIKLDDTAAIASALEAIDIPAMDAATWYKHSLSLANPHLDTAIISIGIYQVANVADFTFYIDEVDVSMSTSKVYKELSGEYWNIAKGTTPYLQLTTQGLNVIGENTQLRLTGLQIISRMDADATVSDIDPAWLIARVTGRLLISHAKSPYLDIEDRAGLAKYWLGEAAGRETGLTPNTSGCRSVL